MVTTIDRYKGLVRICDHVWEPDFDIMIIACEICDLTIRREVIEAHREFIHDLDKDYAWWNQNNQIYNDIAASLGDWTSVGDWTSCEPGSVELRELNVHPGSVVWQPYAWWNKIQIPTTSFASFFHKTVV